MGRVPGYLRGESGARSSNALGGGGSTIYDFVGSTITATVTMNGHFKFHYDESLSRLGPSRGYVVSSWNEISPN